MATKKISIPLWAYKEFLSGHQNTSQRAHELMTKGILYEVEKQRADNKMSFFGFSHGNLRGLVM
jgi:hypothetical protein